MVNQINPKNFANYDKTKKDIENKILLFEDHDISIEELEYNKKTYALEDPTEINLPGQITDTMHSLQRSLFNIYEWSLLKASFCDGFLFCYLDFVPGDEGESKQLLFKVYRLKEIKFKN